MVNKCLVDDPWTGIGYFSIDLEFQFSPVNLDDIFNRDNILALDLV